MKHNKIFGGFIIPLLFSLTACSSGPLIQHTYGTHGQLEKKTYSFLYKAQKILIPDLIGVDMYIDQAEQFGIPILFQMQQAMESSLNPDDPSLRVPGKLAVYLINLSQNPINVSLLSVKYKDEELLKPPIDIFIAPYKQKNILPEKIKLATHNTEIKDIKLVVQYQDKKYSEVFAPYRLTAEEYEARNDRFRNSHKIGMTAAEIFLQELQH